MTEFQSLSLVALTILHCIHPDPDSRLTLTSSYNSHLADMVSISVLLTNREENQVNQYIHVGQDSARNATFETEFRGVSPLSWS
jgi:hypothetical protein